MINVKISTILSNFVFKKQLPEGKDEWRGCRFFINKDIEECDYWFVYEDIKKTEKTKCPPQNIILITGEPPSIKKYNPKFLKQFNHVITSHQDINHPGKIIQQQALPWMIGSKYKKETKTWDEENYKDYDFFSSKQKIEKTKTISVIFSNKKDTPGHLQRAIFIEKLKKEFGDTLDIFGLGFEEISDKWDGIAPYKYHLAIENSSVPHYWTEKLADAYLGESFPIYYGCPNIEEYFPKKSMTIIDINKVDESIKKIKDIISKNTHEKSINEIKEGKNLVLNKYGFFNLIYKIIEKNNKHQEKNNKHQEKKNMILEPQKKEKGFFRKYLKIKLCSKH